MHLANLLFLFWFSCMEGHDILETNILKLLFPQSLYSIIMFSHFIPYTLLTILLPICQYSILLPIWSMPSPMPKSMWRAPQKDDKKERSMVLKLYFNTRITEQKSEISSNYSTVQILFFRREEGEIMKNVENPLWNLQILKPKETKIIPPSRCTMMMMFSKVSSSCNLSACSAGSDGPEVTNFQK